MKRLRWWPEIRSVGAWWLLVTGVLWLLAGVSSQGPDLGGCAASAALFVALGEVGDRLRRRYWSRTTRRREAG